MLGNYLGFLLLIERSCQYCRFCHEGERRGGEAGAIDEGRAQPPPMLPATKHFSRTNLERAFENLAESSQRTCPCVRLCLSTFEELNSLHSFSPLTNVCCAGG